MLWKIARMHRCMLQIGMFTEQDNCRIDMREADYASVAEVDDKVLRLHDGKVTVRSRSQNDDCNVLS